MNSRLKLIMRSNLIVLLFIFTFSSFVQSQNNTILWKGITWNIEYSEPNLPEDPHLNHWGDIVETQTNPPNYNANVQIDQYGQLHLRLTNFPNGLSNGCHYKCAEVYVPMDPWGSGKGYGEYVFKTKTNFNAFDQNIVTSCYLYDWETGDDNNTHYEYEINHEFSEWSSPGHTIGHQVVQNPVPPCSPPPLLSNDYHPVYNANYEITHKIWWNQNDIFFRSYVGYGDHMPDPSYLLSEIYWPASDFTPQPEHAKLFMNIWLNNHDDPLDPSKVHDFIIKDISFPDPSSSEPYLYQPGPINGTDLVIIPPSGSNLNVSAQFSVNEIGYPVLPAGYDYFWSYSGEGAELLSNQLTSSMTIGFSDSAESGYIMVIPRKTIAQNEYRYGFPRVHKVTVQGFVSEERPPNHE